MIINSEKVECHKVEMILTQEQIDKLYELTRSCDDFNDLATSLHNIRKFHYQINIDPYNRITFTEDIPF